MKSEKNLKTAAKLCGSLAANAASRNNDGRMMEKRKQKGDGMVIMDLTTAHMENVSHFSLVL
ncbi:hypothetical protein ACLOJK_006588 [Asimina triloba]